MYNTEKKYFKGKIASEEIAKKDKMYHTINYLCETCSKRIKEKLIQKSINYKEVLPNNYQLMRDILDNIRTPRNRYLVINTALSDFLYDGTKIGIADKLSFNSLEEVLFGDNKELTRNLPVLHLYIILDIFQNKDFFNNIYKNYCAKNRKDPYEDFLNQKYEKDFHDYYKYKKEKEYEDYYSKQKSFDKSDKDIERDFECKCKFSFNKNCKNEFMKKHTTEFFFSPEDFNIEEILCRYIPFALWSSSKEVSESDVKLDLIPQEVIIKANNFLLSNKHYSEEFKKFLFEFTTETVSFHDLDSKLINNFVVPYVIPTLIKSFSETISLGARVKRMIKDDANYVNSYSKEIYPDLRIATYEYIKKLIDIQDNYNTLQLLDPYENYLRSENCF